LHLHPSHIIIIIIIIIIGGGGGGGGGPCDKRVPVITAWRVLRLRMEERPSIWRVAANILNKQSRTADKG